MQTRGITIILRNLMLTPLSVRFSPKHIEWALPVALRAKKKILRNLRYIAFVDYIIVLAFILLLKLIPNLHFLVILCDLFFFKTFNVDRLDIIILVIDLLRNTFLDGLATSMIFPACSCICILVELLPEGWWLPCEGLLSFFCKVANTLDVIINWCNYKFSVNFK